jgi:hypothetical protein
MRLLVSDNEGARLQKSRVAVDPEALCDYAASRAQQVELLRTVLRTVVLPRRNLIYLPQWTCVEHRPRTIGIIQDCWSGLLEHGETAKSVFCPVLVLEQCTTRHTLRHA